MLDYLRIATEEAVAPPELLARYRKLLQHFRFCSLHKPGCQVAS